MPVSSRPATRKGRTVRPLARAAQRGFAGAVTATSRVTSVLPDGSRWLPSVPVDVVPPPMLVGAWASCPPVVDTKPLVLFVGHMEFRKAPEVLIEALGIVAQHVPDVEGVFIGRPFGGPNGRQFDEYVMSEALRLGVGCEVLPPRAGREAMLELYARARVVAVPSRFETLSMVALEALACGRPAVMTTSVGASEWVRDELPALVVAPDDAAALAQALRPLLENAEDAARVGDRGRAVIAAACTPAAIVGERIAIYTRVVASRRGRRGRGSAGTDG